MQLLGHPHTLQLLHAVKDRGLFANTLIWDSNGKEQR